MKGVYGMKADMIVKGMIYDGRELLPSGTAFAVKDGRYCYLGPQEKAMELKAEHTVVLSVDSGMVMPELFEGHAHVCSGVDLFRGVNLYGYQTPEQYQRAVNDYINRHPEKEYIIGRGFLNGDFGSVGPTAKLLDELETDKYIILDSEDCHSSWVNSKVLKAAGIDETTQDMQNGVIVRYHDSKRPTGWLKEKEMDRVRELLPRYGVEDYKEGIVKYQELALSLGIGCTYEPVMNDKNDIPLRLRAYQELDLEGKLLMQFRAGITMDPADDIETILHMVMDFRAQNTGSHFKLMGIKVFIDGVIEGHTAFLRKPYADMAEDCGYNMWQQEKLNTLFVRAAEQDISMHVHAIGDAAVDSALEAFEKAAKIAGGKELRNCITHLQVVGEDQFPRLHRLGIIAVTNPFWHFKNPAYYDSLEIPYLGKERADREYPMQSFFQHEITVTQASDWPVTYNFNPFMGMETAVTRREACNTVMDPLGETEAATPEQMLRALTINGAWQMQAEQELGSIEVGKKAGFIMIDRNIREVLPHQLSEIRILKHFIDGKEVYCRQV